MSEKYWRDEVQIYSDGAFEVLWGYWKCDTRKTLGVHWTKTEGSVCCPVLKDGTHGWLVIPSFLVLSTLNNLLAEVRHCSSHGSKELIHKAIREFAENMD